MSNRSVGVLALIGITVGVLGSWATGCSLSSGGTLGIDDNPEDEDTTLVQQRVPGTGDEVLSPDFLNRPDGHR